MALPRDQNLFIRARGYTATGAVESVRNVYRGYAAVYLPLLLRGR